MKNVQADTNMRQSISGEGSTGSNQEE